MNIPLQKLFGWFRMLQLWVTGDWQLHHNNVPAHASRFLQSFLAKHQIIQVTQPHYSLDLVPFDFWLFPKFKSPLKGKRFQTINEIQEIWWGSWWCFQQRILQSVLNSGKDTGRTVWSSKMPTLKGTEVHCPMYNISSLINAFIFHIAWLDTFKQTSYVSRSGIGGSCGPHSLSTWSSTCHLYWPFFFRMPMFKLNPDTSYPQIHSLGKWPP